MAGDNTLTFTEATFDKDVLNSFGPNGADRAVR
jgi:hypothetical protein